MKDYYKILEVLKTSSDEEIKKAYKKKALYYHPDRTTGNLARFQELNEAYEILSNKEKKNNYDISLIINCPPNYNNYFNNSNLSNEEILLNIFPNRPIPYHYHNNNNSSYLQSKKVYIDGDIKIEKSIVINNGIKKEKITETNLTTGEKKERIKT